MGGAERMTGHCLCGAVQVETESPPLLVVHCHCTMCRRHSGAGFLTYAKFEAAGVRFTGAAPQPYRSSPEACRSHCSVCGSPVGFLYDSEPDHIYLVAGLLDRAASLRPEAHWFAEEKLPWVKLDDGLPHFAALP